VIIMAKDASEALSFDHLSQILCFDIDCNCCLSNAQSMSILPNEEKITFIDTGQQF
jgi:hypothetical protein